MLSLVCNWTEEEEEVKGLVCAFKEKRREGGERAVVFFVSGLPNEREDKKESRALDKSFRKKKKRVVGFFVSGSHQVVSLSLSPVRSEAKCKKERKGFKKKKKRTTGFLLLCYERRELAADSLLVVCAITISYLNGTNTHPLVMPPSFLSPICSKW